MQLELELHKARCTLSEGDAASFLPGKPQGRFLRMFLGPINVRASRKDIQLKVKEEYNNYRVSMHAFLCLFILLSIFHYFVVFFCITTVCVSLI